MFIDGTFDKSFLDSLSSWLIKRQRIDSISATGNPSTVFLRNSTICLRSFALHSSRPSMMMYILLEEPKATRNNSPARVLVCRDVSPHSEDLS